MTPDDLYAATPAQPVQVGRYHVTGLLGRGGMGSVFDAVDREHGTRVALKTLTHLRPESLLRFKNEFRAAADLSHPNLIPLYELGCEDDLWFFTMERIEGMDFISWLRGSITAPGTSTFSVGREPSTIDDSTRELGATLDVPADAEESVRAPSPPPEVGRLRDAFGQLVRGVRALHLAGLLHLDLKPSNVLVDRNGRVVVLDFGLVRSIRPLSGESSGKEVAGSPAWMAPEQHDGINVGESADWYAVGLMLYVALTGVPAFRQSSSGDLRYAKRFHRPPPPAAILPGSIPSDLSWLADILIDPEPTRRPPGSAIQEIASGRGRVPEVGAALRSDVVGRQDERTLLTAALERIRTGGMSVIHLSGPSGVGKSALLGSLVDEAGTDERTLVLRGRCYERETVPYKAFDGILDTLALQLSSRADLVPRLPEWIRELSHVFPVLLKVPTIRRQVEDGPAESVPRVGEIRRRAVEALRDLFRSLAAHQPLVLAIDDLQWADADSTTMLLKLLERPAPPGLMIAASFRPEATANPAVHPWLELAGTFATRPDVSFTEIHVAPLRVDDAERLAEATLTALDVHVPGLASGIAREAGGVPFFVQELAHDAARQCDAGQVPSPAGMTLERVLARRVQSLASTERALVELLAVSGSPIPLAVAFTVGGVDAGSGRRALWALSSGLFVRSTGAGANDRVELHHDRMREGVLASLPPERLEHWQLGLGRALATRGAEGEPGEWLFDAVRHFNGVAHRLEGAERLTAARLNLTAGQRAQRAAAFPLAFSCFQAGIRLLPPNAWQTDYELALRLHAGAAEAAYLCGDWDALAAHVALVKAHGRTLSDQLPAWESQIDGCIARTEYVPALEAALEVLRLLGIELPAQPGEAEVGAEVQAAMAALGRVGVEGVQQLPLAGDARILAGMRILTRISSAAYFARPLLLPVIACRLAVTSVEHGLSPATPYAVSIYGLVLNTIGMHAEAHQWGQLALRLIDRFDDRTLEARTRHVVNDLVCVWTVPLASTLEALRNVIRIGQATGDPEYAAYAAHGYVHNALYAGRPLEPLLKEALALGDFMRSHQQNNALHVHRPFEQLLRCLTGKAHDPARLDGEGFQETVALDWARAVGSRSAQCLLQLLMGIARYHFGTASEASACLEAARPFLDGVASTWHVPMHHQYAALAIHGLPEAERGALLAQAEASLAALRALAAHGPENFEHRVALIEAERARADGDSASARERFAAAIAGAERGGWLNDLALAHELAARAASEPEAADHRRAAAAVYARWGASAKAARLA